MKSSQQQTVIAGAALIALGVIAWLGLWHIIWPGALLVAGGVVYTQRRQIGRTVEAVQGGLWCVGLALLFLMGLVWPGILILAGSSILARGREYQIDTWVQSTLGRIGSRSAVAPSLPASTPPVAPVYPPTPVMPQEQPNTGDTRRL